MPASMIMAEGGDRRKVKGSSSAIAGIGPMPGSTPIAVPMTTPIRQNSKLLGCRAVVSPISSLSKSSMSEPCSRPDRHRQGQRLDEEQHRPRREPEGGEKGFYRPPFPPPDACDHQPRPPPQPNPETHDADR